MKNKSNARKLFTANIFGFHELLFVCMQGPQRIRREGNRGKGADNSAVLVTHTSGCSREAEEEAQQSTLLALKEKSFNHELFLFLIWTKGI